MQYYLRVEGKWAQSHHVLSAWGCFQEPKDVKEGIMATFKPCDLQDLESKLCFAEDKESFVNDLNGSKTGPLYRGLCTPFDHSGCLLMLPIISAVIN